MALILPLIFVASTVSAVPPSDVLQRLATTEKALSSCSLTIRSTIRNVGAGGREIQKIDREERVWVHKASKQVKRAIGDAEQVWDCAKGKTARKQGSAIIERTYEYGIEVATPYPLVYIAYPAYFLGQMDIVSTEDQGALLRVVGRPIGSDPKRGDNPRTEVSVDMRKGAIDRIRVFDGKNREVEDIRLEGWIRYGDSWMPRQVRRYAYGANNVMVSKYSLSAVEINAVTSKAVALR